MNESIRRNTGNRGCGSGVGGVGGVDGVDSANGAIGGLGLVVGE